MSRPPLPPVPPQVDLPAMEREILALWQDTTTFDAQPRADRGRPDAGRSTRARPTANGQPGVHHVEARVFKDVFPRYKTMQGYHVARKAGWDCHGLPVEIAVEKELGFTGKQDIEAYGVAEFNAQCRESVLRHVDEFEQMTERMGYWVDTDRRLPDDGPELRRERLVVAQADLRQGPAGRRTTGSRPYCPRCGTGLSDHELAQGYETVVDPSVYVRFPLTSGPYAGTGRPAGLDDDAVDPGLQHRRRRAPGRHLRRAPTDGTERWSSPSRCSTRRWARAGPSPTAFTGAEMERWTYQRPLDLRRLARRGHFVVLADYVTTDDGTGLVHQSPAFGAEDLAVVPGYGLPVVNPVQPDGHFEDDGAAGRRRVLQARRQGAGRRPRGAAACCSATQAYEHSLPALLALPHRAALLRASRPGTSARPQSRTPCCAENEQHRLVPRDHQVGPLRRLAAQQHRLGAVAQPLLGHAAADLALRRRRAT